MKGLKRAGTVVIITGLIGFVVSGCKKSESEGGTPTYSANFSTLAFVTSDGAYVKVYDKNGNSVGDARVLINNDTLFYIPAPVNLYVDTAVKYEKGKTYTLAIDAGELGEITSEVTAPGIDSVVIDEPMDNQTVPKNTPLPVRWHYEGGDNDGKVMVTFSYEGSDTGFSSGFLNGGTVQYQIPGEVLDKDGNATINVYAGNYKELSGLPVPPRDTTFGFNPGFSIFGVVTEAKVKVIVGQGGGTIGGNWMGIMWGQVSGSHVDSLNSPWYYYESGNTYQVQLKWESGQETFMGVGAFPPAELSLPGNLGDTLILGTIEIIHQDTILGSWDLKGINSGSGQFGGIRIGK